jgi:hypothetical protein
LFAFRNDNETELSTVRSEILSTKLKGIAMGSPISGLIDEIFHYEQYLINNSLDSTTITFYNRYVDNIIIIYDQNRTNADDIQKFMNKIHKDLQFKATEEKGNNISFLHILINRENNSLSINIYRKPTITDTTIHYKSNHPTKHKIAAYRYMINRLHNLPSSQEQKHQEWNTILQIAQKNGYPTTLIKKLNKRISTKRNSMNDNKLPPQIDNRIWITFE